MFGGKVILVINSNLPDIETNLSWKQARVVCVTDVVVETILTS